jgi:predicted alpha/beta hydrolase family esterase
MTQALIYVHGLNSSSSSSKYQYLKELFDDAYCIEWPNDDNFSFDKIANEIKAISKSIRMQNDAVVLVGDSTGANFVLQFQKEFGHDNISNFVLISPLVNRQSVLIDHTIFNKKVDDQLVDFDIVKGLMVLSSANDEVLNHTNYEKMCELHHNETAGDHKKPYTLQEIGEYVNRYSGTLFI